MRHNLFVSLAIVIVICIPQYAEAVSEDEQQNISYVFELAKTGTPEQLRQAVQDGYSFNVRREFDFYGDDDSEEDDEIYIFDKLSPLHIAAAYNHNPESIKYLLSLGLDINVYAESGNTAAATPLSLAVRKKNFPVLNVLLDAGADPDSWCNDAYSTIIHLVVGEYDNPDEAKFIIDTLVKGGGNVNAHMIFQQEDIQEWYEHEGRENFAVDWSKDDPFGEKIYNLSHAAMGNFLSSFTPLMFAVLYDKPEIAGILLDAGAAPNPRSMEGKTALDYAMLLPKDSKLRSSPVFKRLEAASKKR